MMGVFYHGGTEPEWGSLPICRKCALSPGEGCLAVESLPERDDPCDPYALPGLVNIKMTGPRLNEGGCSHFQRRT